jgi:hypothetical protein
MADFARIVALYDGGDGLSIPQLAARFQRSNQSIRYALLKSGVRSKGKRPACLINA